MKGIQIGAADANLISCLNLLQIPDVCGEVLPIQNTALFQVADIAGFSFDKADALATPLDRNAYGVIMRLQKRVNREISTDIQNCMTVRGITLKGIQHTAYPAAEYLASSANPLPANTLQKGIIITRQNNCYGDASGIERLIIDKFTIYPAASYTDTPLYIETNGIQTSIVLPNLIAGVANVFSTTQQNSFYRLASPIISETGDLALSLPENISVYKAKPLCSSCNKNRCFTAHGFYSTNSGTTISHTDAYGIVPFVSCYCDVEAMICSFAYASQFRLWWLAKFAVVIAQEAIISDEISNYTIYSTNERATAALQILLQKEADAANAFCNTLPSLVKSSRDRCLQCNGGYIGTMI